MSKVAVQTEEPIEAHLSHVNVQYAVCSSLAGFQGLLYGALNRLFSLLHNCTGKLSLHMVMRRLQFRNICTWPCPRTRRSTALLLCRCAGFHYHQEWHVPGRRSSEGSAASSAGALTGSSAAPPLPAMALLMISSAAASALSAAAVNTLSF